jgi:methylmalonyl-CoA/ethylmalonyl-CoA epimerase
VRARARPALALLRRLDHTGFSVSDLEAAIVLFREQLGATTGPIYEDPLQRVRICFAEYDGGRVELIAPLGEGSPIARVLAQGGGAYHLCFETEDLEPEVRRLRGKGFVPTGTAKPATAFGGRRVVFLFHPLARLVELVENPSSSM